MDGTGKQNPMTGKEWQFPPLNQFGGYLRAKPDESGSQE